MFETERRHRGRDRLRLATPRRGARTTEHREVVEHDDGVFDEDPVGLIVGGVDLDDLPAALTEGIHIAAPLRQGEVRVDRHPLEVFGQVQLGNLGSFHRAVGPAPCHLLAPGGRLLAMKGVNPVEEIAALPPGWTTLAVHPLAVPGLGAERHLVEVGRGP